MSRQDVPEMIAAIKRGLITGGYDCADWDDDILTNLAMDIASEIDGLLVRDRKNIADAMRKVARGLIVDPESDGVDGYIAAVLIGQADVIAPEES
jgi:hypothetical protein